MQGQLRKIHILSSLNPQAIPPSGKEIYYYCTRKLFPAEIQLIQARGLKRYYLKSLREEQAVAFFEDFDKFWDGVIKDKRPEDRFWRNSVSSKMLEWENSVGYLALTPFTITEDASKDAMELFILPDSRQEACIWHAWALGQGWTVVEDNFGLGQRVVQEIENITRSLRLVFLFFMKKWRAGPSFIQLKRKAILVITLFYSGANLKEKYEDLFFGNLSEDIDRKGMDALFMGDGIDQKQKTKEGWPVNIYSLMSWFDFFAGLWSVVNYRASFIGCSFRGVDFSSILEWHARRFRYDFNLTAEFFYRAVGRVSKKHPFEKMLFPFEGNIFERGAIQAFRRANPSGVIDGYSHAVVYPLNLKLHLTLLEADLSPQPDRYLVCGEHAKNMLTRIRRIKVPVISVCSLRSIQRKIERIPTLSREILIVLDGVWSTTYLLNWLCEHSKVFKGYKVMIRPHPNVNGQRLWRQCPDYSDGLFSISHRSLNDDLREADCVLYRQSSVGVMALMNKIPIIQLNIDLPLSGDPLEGIDKGRISVTDEKGLREALGRVPDLSRSLSLNPQEALAQVQNYFVEPSVEMLNPFMELYAEKV